MAEAVGPTGCKAVTPVVASEAAPAETISIEASVSVSGAAATEWVEEKQNVEGNERQWNVRWNVPRAALLRVFLRTVPLFSVVAEGGPRPPAPPATCRPDRRVVEDGGGGVVDVGKETMVPGPDSLMAVFTGFLFEFRLLDLSGRSCL